MESCFKCQPQTAYLPATFLLKSLFFEVCNLYRFYIEKCIHLHRKIYCAGSIRKKLLRPSAFYGGFDLMHISLIVIFQVFVCGSCALLLCSEHAVCIDRHRHYSPEEEPKRWVQSLPFGVSERMLRSSLDLSWLITNLQPDKPHNLKNVNCPTDVNMHTCSARPGL